MVWTARGLTLLGWVLHGIGLGTASRRAAVATARLRPRAGEPAGLPSGGALPGGRPPDRAAVLGAFLAPAAVAVLVPRPVDGRPGPERPAVSATPLLPVAHIGRGAHRPRRLRRGHRGGGGLPFARTASQGEALWRPVWRLPSLELLDDLNRRLVIWGFIALSLTLVTGLGVAAHSADAGACVGVELTIVVAWLVFAGLLQARVLAGWRGRRVAWLTMAGLRSPRSLLRRHLQRRRRTMSAALVCLGVSHHTAPLALRERMALTAEAQTALLQRLGAGPIEALLHLHLQPGGALRLRRVGGVWRTGCVASWRRSGARRCFSTSTCTRARRPSSTSSGWPPAWTPWCSASRRSSAR